MSVGIAIGIKAGEAAAAATYPRLADSLGAEWEQEPGKVFRLVKLNHSGGFGTTGTSLDAGAKVFEWVDEDLYTVKPANAATDRVAGVSIVGQANLADGDVFQIQIDGQCYVTTASDGALVEGEFVIGDDDTDLGKVTSGTTTETPGVDFAIALAAQASADSTCLVRIVRKL